MKYFLPYITSDNITKVILGIVVITIISTNPSYAQNFSGVESFLETLVKAITGPIGRLVSALAVIAVGFSFMIGRMDWTFAVSVVVGIAIVFGGATFVTGLVAK